MFDNILIGRLRRTVKCKEVYLNDYQTVRETDTGLSWYFDFYNTEQFDSSLGDLTPMRPISKNGEIINPG